MMHGRGKSDFAIVAEKPANKAGSTAAEPVEPRAETEGNADQQSTGRTQGRESVSQALERIRKVARERKEERFTALPPSQSRPPRGGVLRAQGECRPRGGWADLDGLRGRPRAQARGPAFAAPSRSVPGTAIPSGPHSQAGRWRKPACGRRPGGQDRSTGDGRSAERDLRGGGPRGLVRG